MAVFLTLNGKQLFGGPKLLLHVYIPPKTIYTTKILPQLKEIILNDFGAKNAVICSKDIQ